MPQERQVAAANSNSALIAILVVAAALRLFGLSSQSFWLDEAHSWNFARESLERALSAEPTNPPLYYVILHFWMQLFGDSEWAIRSLSVIPSVVGVFLTYVLGERLFDRRVGLFAALYMAISTFQISYAQEARTFALVLALQLGAMVAMHSMLTARSVSRSSVAIYILLNALSCYSHFYAVFFIVAQNAVFLLHWLRTRKGLVGWVLTQLTIIALFVPWLLRMFGAAKGAGQVRRYLLLKPPQAMLSFLVGDSLVPLDESAVHDIAGTLIGNAHWLILTAFAFGVFAIFAIRARRVHPAGFWSCILLVLIPMLIAAVVSLKMPLFEERYFLAITPFLFLWMSFGATQALAYLTNSPETPNRPERSRLATAAAGAAFFAVALVLSVSLLNYFFTPRFGKEQWREVVPLIDNNALAGDILVLDPDFIGVCYRYYSKRPAMESIEMTTKLRDEAGMPVLEQGLKKAKRVWLLRSHHEDDRVLEFIKGRTKLVQRYFFPKDKGIEVLLFEGVAKGAE